MSTERDIVARFQAGGVLLDGGLGSMLIATGLESGKAPEGWNLSRPDAVRAVHAKYADAGAMVITTNTFGATPSRLAQHEVDDPAGATASGVTLAREAADATGALVALSMGPTGAMIAPVGNATEEQLQDEFVAQLEAAGTGYDLILIETMFDIREALAALRAAKQLVSAPVAVTMTFGHNPRGFHTVMGNEAVASIRGLEEAGADIVGANCTLDSAGMLELAPLLLGAATRPVLCQPNAGQPVMRDRKPAYDQTPGDFADDAARLFDMGVHAVGGCCGTDPRFITELAARAGA